MERKPDFHPVQGWPELGRAGGCSAPQEYAHQCTDGIYWEPSRYRGGGGRGDGEGKCVISFINVLYNPGNLIIKALGFLLITIFSAFAFT